MFKPMLKKIKEVIDIGYAVADKGFDSESNHKFAHKIGADSVIPLRYRQPYLKRKVTTGESCGAIFQKRDTTRDLSLKQ